MINCAHPLAPNSVRIQNTDKYIKTRYKVAGESTDILANLNSKVRHEDRLTEIV